MASESILPKDPSNTGGVNNTGHADHEQLRFDFLRRFNNYPSLFSVVLCVQQYLNTPTLNTTGAFDFGANSRLWRKGGVLKNINKDLLYVKIANYEAPESFCKDVVWVIKDDIRYNVQQQQAAADAQATIIAAQQAIINDSNSTSEQVAAAETAKQAALDARQAAFTAKFQFSSMLDRLDEYTTNFLNYATITNEVINTLQVLMAYDDI